MKRDNNINREIRAVQVRLIDAEGNNIGVVPIRDAIQKAQDAGLDLVEMSAGGGTPVCRIIDYNKYIYDQKAKLKKNKAKKADLKEFKLGPNISEGDLKVRINRGKEFLTAGDVVKYTLVLKGREAMFPEVGKLKLKIIESELADVAKMEGGQKFFGNTISVTFTKK